jgi:mannose-1-phosphate guanylyltransferase
MLEFHRQRKAVATIALTPVENPSAYGLIETDDNGRVLRFLEKPEPSEITTNLINAGTYILEPEVLEQIPPDMQVSIEREIYPKLVSSGRTICAFPSSGYWMDMGTPEKYLQLHRDLLDGKSTWYSPGTSGDASIGEGCDIAFTVQFDGSVVIGNNCTVAENVRLTGPVVIGDGCVIGKGSNVENSIVWNDVRLGSEVSIQSSLIADSCNLSDGCTLDGVVLGDHVNVTAGARLEPDSRIESGETVG